MTKLLFLTPGFAAHEADHNCIPPLQALVRSLQQRGAEVCIVALEYPFTDRPYHWHGAAVYPCNGQNRLWLKPRTLWRAMTHAHELLDRHDILAIHSFWLGMAAGVGERVSLRRGVPHFTTLMGQDVLPSNRRHLGSLTDERFGRLVALSAFHNDVLEKTTRRRAAQIIHWGLSEVPPPMIPPLARPLDVLGVGSLVRVKNWSKWLQTLGLIAQSRPDLRAELIGDGPERQKLERLCQSLGLSEQVHFAGNLPRPEVLRRMTEARVLLHTADFESFGFVFPEAVRAGCRLVSTPVGIAPEMGAVCGSTEAKLATLILTALQTPKLPTLTRPPDIEATMEAYWGLWTKP